jgi:hypothetical protein
MKGTVALINPRNGFFVVQVEPGDFTVVEMLGGCSIEVGDVVSGNLRSLGGEDLRNETQRETMSVFIQDIHSSASNARAMAFR